jgi:hypothetical protein
LQAINDSSLSKARRSALLVIIKSAQKVSLSKTHPKLRRAAEVVLLNAAIQLIEGYKKHNQINIAEYNLLKEMITSLKNKNI